jgi:hypothetical protein
MNVSPFAKMHGDVTSVIHVAGDTHVGCTNEILTKLDRDEPEFVTVKRARFPMDKNAGEAATAMEIEAGGNVVTERSIDSVRSTLPDRTE